MKKIVTALLLTFGLLLGGTVAPATAADESRIPCPVAIPGDCVPSPPTEDPCAEAFNELWAEKESLRVRYEYADQVRTEQHAVIVGLRAQLEASQASTAHQRTLAERRAATIQRLRAKIRALR